MTEKKFNSSKEPNTLYSGGARTERYEEFKEKTEEQNKDPHRFSKSDIDSIDSED